MCESRRGTPRSSCSAHTQTARRPFPELLGTVDGRFFVLGLRMEKGGDAHYSLLAPAVLAAGLLSDAVLPDVSDLFWLEAFALSEPSLPAPVAGVAEELPRWSVL